MVGTRGVRSLGAPASLPASEILGGEAAINEEADKGVRAPLLKVEGLSQALLFAQKA